MKNSQTSHYQNKGLWAETVRKNAIIKELIGKIDYSEGDYTQPAAKENIEKYGTTILVESICDNYTKLGNTVWPDNDMPMLITAYSVDTKERFFCTPNFLEPILK